MILPLKIFSGCPKCNNNIDTNKDGIVIFKLSKYCEHCGQDLMKCKAQTNKEIKKRKDEERIENKE